MRFLGESPLALVCLPGSYYHSASAAPWLECVSPSSQGPWKSGSAVIPFRGEHSRQEERTPSQLRKGSVADSAGFSVVLLFGRPCLR